MTSEMMNKTLELRDFPQHSTSLRCDVTLLPQFNVKPSYRIVSHLAIHYTIFGGKLSLQASRAESHEMGIFNTAPAT
jgi:hypothetical protein